MPTIAKNVLYLYMLEEIRNLLVQDKFELQIEPNLDLIECKIINDYWEFDGKKFIYSMAALSRKYNIKPHKVSALIRDYSQVTIFFGYCKYCNTKLKIETNGQGGITNIRKLPVTCKSCRYIDEYKIYISNYYLKHNIEFDYSIIDANLSTRELAILYKILFLHNRKLIFEYVFLSTVENEEIWEIVFKLGKVNLLPLNDLVTKNITNLLIDSYPDRTKVYGMKLHTYKHEDYHNELDVSDFFPDIYNNYTDSSLNREIEVLNVNLNRNNYENKLVLNIEIVSETDILIEKGKPCKLYGLLSD